MEKTLRTLKGTVNTAGVRIANLKGEDHVVFPVVAMIGDLVMYPMGSDPTKNGEFVPAEELSDLPQKWNGTMVVPDHPTDPSTGAAIAASTPAVATAMGYGEVYNSHFAKGALQFEIWLSQARAEIVGLGSVEAIADAQAGKLVENSVGFYSTMEETEGVSPSGIPYSFKHSDLVPEHFAFGLNGATGACSVADGCGGPRVASADLKPRSRVLRAAANKDENLALRLLRRAYHTAADLGVSDNDLRKNIAAQLTLSVLGFDWVRAVFQKTNTVIYEVFLSNIFTLWQQSFSVSEDGSITLTGDIQQVIEQGTTEFIPFTPIAVVANESNNSEPKPNPEQGRITMNEEARKALVAKIVASKANSFTTKDQESLMKADDGLLSTLAAGAATEPVEPVAATTAALAPIPAVSPTVAPVATKGDCGCQDTPEGASEPVQATSAPEGTVFMTVAEHAKFTSAMEKIEAQDLAHRAALTAAVIGANSALTEDDLKPMSLAVLTKMAPAQRQHTGLVDYSALGLPMPVIAEASKIPGVTSLSNQLKPKAPAAVN